MTDVVVFFNCKLCSSVVDNSNNKDNSYTQSRTQHCSVYILSCRKHAALVFRFPSNGTQQGRVGLVNLYQRARSYGILDAPLTVRQGAFSERKQNGANLFTSLTCAIPITTMINNARQGRANVLNAATRPKILVVGSPAPVTRAVFIKTNNYAFHSNIKWFRFIMVCIQSQRLTNESAEFGSLPVFFSFSNPHGQTSTAYTRGSGQALAISAPSARTISAPPSLLITY